MFSGGRLTVDLNPFKPYEQPAVLVAPPIDPLVLHVPAVGDSIHYTIESILLVGLPCLEHFGVKVQGQWDVFKFVLLQIGRNRAPKRKPF